MKPGFTRWVGVDHGCAPSGQTMRSRDYPEFHWLGEGPNDSQNHPVAEMHHPDHRKVLVCDACGAHYALPEEAA